MNRHIVLYFGSFNPIHNGHISIATFMAGYKDVDEVWLVVSPQNPFKKNEDLLPGDLRLKMAREGLKDHPKLGLCDLEFSLPKPSYTIHTLNTLKEKYPQYTFSILMGADSFSDIHKWKDHEDILKQCKVYIYGRRDVELSFDKPGNFVYLDAPLLDISATQIRNLLKEGKSLKGLVPQVVEDMLKG